MPGAGPAVSTGKESPQAELLLGQGWRLETRDDVTVSPSRPEQTCPKSLVLPYGGPPPGQSGTLPL